MDLTTYYDLKKPLISELANINNLNDNMDSLDTLIYDINLAIIALGRGPLSGVFANAIINSNFQINQRAVTPYTSSTVPANSDDTYCHDCWTLLSDGNNVVNIWSNIPDINPNISGSSISFQVQTANKKFGYIQFIEAKDSTKFNYKRVSLQFKGLTVPNNPIRNVRAAVLSWNGATDVLTSDVVSNWGAQGTNPTLVANWTAENVATNNALVNSTWTTYKIENIYIDTSSMANLAVFIWCDDTDCAQSDLFYLADVQLNEGPVCTPYMQRSFQEDLVKCQRFYQKSFPYATVPATQAGYAGAINYAVAFTGVGYYSHRVYFPVEMRIGGTPTYYNPVSNNAKWYNRGANADSGGADVPYQGGFGERGLSIENLQVAGDNVGNNLYVHYKVTAPL